MEVGWERLSVLGTKSGWEAIKQKKKIRCINISVESCSDIGQLLVSDYVSMWHKQVSTQKTGGQEWVRLRVSVGTSTRSGWTSERKKNVNWVHFSGTHNPILCLMGILVKVSNCKYIKYKTKQRERQRQRQRQRERKEGRNSVGGVRELREMANSWAKITFGCMQCCVQVAFGHIVVPSFMWNIIPPPWNRLVVVFHWEVDDDGWESQQAIVFLSSTWRFSSIFTVTDVLSTNVPEKETKERWSN